jgi:hypothetical protein
MEMAVQVYYLLLFLLLLTNQLLVIITSTTGATGGDIIIYKYTAALSHWDSLTITPIGGTYTFNNIDSGLSMC